MDHLPPEILGEILLRLPVASLLRLCCVSKSLNDFINGSFFVHLHSKHSQNSSGRRVLHLKGRGRQRRSWNSNDSNTRRLVSICPFDRDDDDQCAPIDFPLPFTEAFVVRLFGSCNGIVCISVCSSIYLCNPTTRKFLTLPNFSFASNYAVTHGIGMGFDSSTENYFVIRLVWFLGALKLDPSTIHYDFEVSSLLTDEPSAEILGEAGSTSSSSSSRGTLAQGWPTLGAEIYNLNSNSWRKLDVVLPHIDERNRAAVLGGRYFHWCTKSGKILSFDMKAQTFRLIEIPVEAEASFGFRIDRLFPTWNVGVLDGSLAFLLIFRGRVEVWTMEGYGMEDSWTKRYSIIPPVMNISIPSISCWNDGKLFLVSEEQLLSCHLQNDSNGGIKIYGDICRAPNYSLSYVVYQESLVSLYRGHKGMLWRKM